MKITGGYLKGLSLPQKIPGILRPAMGKIRESMFQRIGDITRSPFLDLFSGTGIIGLEAHSRGAEVIMVEKNPQTVRAVRKFLSSLKISIPIYCMPVERFIQISKKRFLYTFCDPPFSYRYKQDLIQRLFDSPLLLPHGLLMLHHPTTETLVFDKEHTTVRFGNSSVAIIDLDKNPMQELYSPHDE